MRHLNQLSLMQFSDVMAPSQSSELSQKSERSELEMNPAKLAYRAEVDGLRAFAVLSVVIFHAFPNWLKGGFIGVDVFFVISGFLITSHIFQSLDNGSFSFSDFFSRRARRIFPALILVMLTSLIIGWFFLLADEYAQLGSHIASGAAFIVNFILEDEIGYFDNEAETKPMLHLWSLAVEEQFYIIWPLLLWLAWKRNFNLFTLTVTVAIMSFALNLIFVGSKPTKTFFWPIGRFWELLSGSILAWVMIYKRSMLASAKGWVGNKLACLTFSKQPAAGAVVVTNLMSLIGILLLVYGVNSISEGLEFPGYWALVPVIGTLFIIGSGSKAWFNQVILMKPIVVWFGLISYPLYLWHWPILSFIYIIDGEPPNLGVGIAAVLLSIFLAWLTYKLVEVPIRFSRKSRSSVLPLVGLLVGVGSCGFGVYALDGVQIRSTAQLGGEAFDNLSKRLKLKEERKYAMENGPNVLIWGDSYADVFAHPIKDILSGSGIGVVGYILHSCPSLIGVLRNEPRRKGDEFAQECHSFTESVIQKLQREQARNEFVVIASNYPWYATGKNMNGEPILVSPNSDENVVIPSLKSTVALVSEMGFKPIVILMHVEFSGGVIRKAIRLGEPESVVSDTAKVIAFNDRIKSALMETDAILVDPIDILCESRSECSAFDRNAAKWKVWRDGNHLSYYGAAQVAKAIKEIMQ